MKRMISILVLIAILFSFAVPVSAEKGYQISFDVEAMEISLPPHELDFRTAPKRGATEDCIAFPGPFCEGHCADIGRITTLKLTGMQSGKSGQYCCILI